jgi:hypothetical protein
MIHPVCRMHRSLLAGALVAAATPLAAQQPNRLQIPASAVVRDGPPTRADTAAILRAASDSVWRFEGGGFMHVADTAWVMVVKTTGSHRMSADSSSDVTTAAFDHQVSRVERRKGKWVLVRRP